MRPVVSSVSHATREYGSPARAASRTASEIWSAILSGWPSVTDSEVKRKLRLCLLKTISLACWPAIHRQLGTLLPEYEFVNVARAQIECQRIESKCVNRRLNCDFSA